MLGGYKQLIYVAVASCRSFLRTFVDKLCGKREDERSGDALSEIAGTTLKTTQMAMEVSVPVHAIPSAYGLKATNVVLQFAKRVSVVIGAME